MQEKGYRYNCRPALIASGGRAVAVTPVSRMGWKKKISDIGVMDIYRVRVLWDGGTAMPISCDAIFFFSVRWLCGS